MCLRLLFPCPQIGNNVWEWSYGKHDEQEFTRLNIVWLGTILDRIFWIAIIRVGIVRVGDILDGNFLLWEFSGWELSGGNHPGGNFPCGSFPSTITGVCSDFFIYHTLLDNSVSLFYFKNFK